MIKGNDIYLKKQSFHWKNIHVRGSFIKLPDRVCNFSKNQVIPSKLCNILYIYISDLCLKFHSFIFDSFILMQINVNA